MTRGCLAKSREARNLAVTPSAAQSALAAGCVERIVGTCLVVDDSAVIRKVASRVLDGLGLAVVEAEDGAQAIAACRGRMPDVAIVDALMTEMDGYEVVRELRRLPDGGRPKVIVSVVESDVATIARVLHAGADSYLMKPFTAALVREKLEEVGILQAAPAEAAA